VLVNGGVKLACEGHPCLEKLEALAEVRGVHPGLRHLPGLLRPHGQEKELGDTTNMLDVVTSLDMAAKVIQV
jgi:hypothetical protein